MGLSLSLEAGYQRHAFSPDTWTLELRPIIDHQLGPWYLSFPPVFERSLKVASVPRGFECSPKAKISDEVTATVTFGLE